MLAESVRRIRTS